MHQWTGTPRTRVVPTLATVVVAAVALAGCGAGDGAPDPAATTGAAEAQVPASSSDATPVVVTGNVLGREIEMSVGPVVLDGDLAVLRVEAEATSGDDTLFVGEAFANRTLSQEDTFDGVRLVDLDAGVVREPARAADGVALASLEDDRFELGPDEEPVVGHVAFAAPASATTAVLVPYLGLVEDVPVVAADDAEGLTVPAAELAPAGLDDVVAPTAVLETFSTSANDAVSTRDTDDLVSVAIDSDVLFAVDSAELGTASDAALQAVADQLALAADGELVVVGHTDDQGEEAANQELSERRAHAVADRLGEIADLGRFDVRVEGRGETEPVATDGTDEARALNRRVTVEFVPAADRSPAEVPAAGELTAPEGATVDGLGGATLEHADGLGGTQTLHVELVEVRRAGGYLVGTLDVRNDGTDHAAFVSVLGSVLDGRGELGEGGLGANNVTLLDGGVRVYPVDYLVDPAFYPDSARSVLADLSVGSLSPGVTSRVTVVWPDRGGETVVVDVPDGSTEVTDGSTPVRFVDVPVAD
ncbi:OmpA family protein [Cellulosimicrobium cellulans]|uniref:OmpA family protein n=1 Tax=Cellulosimicrobium cellulans TaxID=1710 RepID=UPI002096B0A0|nr:OmpA family protein [Cellulosimicrobium cellulans]MCO7272629.1 OmpA family protein [Cellulosimicrobium cellulans]